VARVDAWLDDVPWVLDADLEGVLEPAALGDGPHSLEVRVEHDDETPAVVVRVDFAVRVDVPPGWDADIRPIFSAECALCHGSGGSARDLGAKRDWVEQVDAILENVRQGRMPLPPNPPLNPESVGLIEAWRAAGFPD
jgi:hypothetical protein